MRGSPPRLTVRVCFFLYPSLPQDITNKWSEVRELVPRRDQTLQQEMMRQQNNERLRRQFAAKANVVGQWVETQLDAVASIGVQMRGSLEDQLKKLQAFDKAITSYRPNIEELERYNQVRLLTCSVRC